MKLMILLLTFMSGTAMASGYEPFKFRCVYNSGEGLITATSKINPDNDAWTFLLKSSVNNKSETLEAASAYVYVRDEKTDPKTEKIVKALAAKLRINSDKWFTTTDITLFEGQPTEMRFFKFNSKTGTLGIGIHAERDGQDVLTKCK